MLSVFGKFIGEFCDKNYSHYSMRWIRHKVVASVKKILPKTVFKNFQRSDFISAKYYKISNSEKIDYDPAITVTNSEFRFIVDEQLEEIGENNGSILIEPSARNTAPAILASCIYALKKDPSGIFSWLCLQTT